MRILIHSENDVVLGPMVYGFMDYYTSKKVTVHIKGIKRKNIHPTVKKVMKSTGIDFDSSFKTFEKSKSSKQEYSFHLTAGHPVTDQVISLHLDGLESPVGWDDLKKSEFKKLRSKVRTICEDFVEQYVEGDHIRNKKIPA
ncbi:MAG: hypothetical protein WBA16_08740 [Nonlabens sp.]